MCTAQRIGGGGGWQGLVTCFLSLGRFGSFTCACNAGYEDNTIGPSATGVDCISINECTGKTYTLDPQP